MNTPPGFEPSYLELFRSGELAERASRAVERLASCDLCARYCLVDRFAGVKGAVCRTGRRAVVSSLGPHHGEEDPLRGFRGSGTIFFSWCNLRCVFCQNSDISQRGVGQEVETEDPSAGGDAPVRTAAFAPFGTPGKPGRRVAAGVPCTASVMRCRARRDRSRARRLGAAQRLRPGLSAPVVGSLVDRQQPADRQRARSAGRGQAGPLVRLARLRRRRQRDRSPVHTAAGPGPPAAPGQSLRASGAGAGAAVGDPLVVEIS